MPRNLRRAFFYWLGAYWFVTALGTVLTIVLGYAFDLPAYWDIGVAPIDAPAYLASEPFHPLATGGQHIVGGNTMLSAIVGVLAGLLLLGFVSEQVSRRRERRYPLPGRLVDVGGFRLHVTDNGQGGPPVVVIHGAGETSFSWTHVRKEVARFTRVLTYDRPGLGASDPGPALGAVQSVDGLHTLLRCVGLPGPYVLVGHSLGGLIARLYAIRYPEQVAGMVLVDSTHEFLKDDAKFRKGFAAIGLMLRILRATSPFGLPRFLGDVLGIIPMYPERPFYAKQLSPEEYRQWRAIVYRNCAGKAGTDEFRAVFPMLEEAVRQMQDGREGPQFGDMPLAVLTNPGFGDEWAAMHRELASRSARSIHIISDRPGHSLQMPQPDLVINAIRHVVDQVRSSPAWVS